MQSICAFYVERITMTLLLNLLWMVLGGGLVSALQYLLAGVVCCLTIIGIPFGLQCFKIAGVALFPFGTDFHEARRLRTAPFNLLWILFAGIWICLSHLALALGLAVTIIGIPFAFQHLKLAMLALAPFDVRVHRVS